MAPTPGQNALAQLDKIAASVQRASRRGGASSRSRSTWSSSRPIRCATGATPRATCATSSTTTARAVEQPWGKLTRCKLFDLPWEAEERRRDALVGQEQVQEEIYRALSNFVQEGRPNRLVLLHGPNGSAQSDHRRLHDARARALLDARRRRALPLPLGLPQSTRRSAARSASAERPAAPAPGSAQLRAPRRRPDRRAPPHRGPRPPALPPPAVATARSSSSARTARPTAAEAAVRDWIMRGQLSHKNQQVFEALLASYNGSLAEVLRHVQVERYFISQRYRVGAVTIGPQMSRRRGRAADHGRSLARRAADVAPGDHALRGERRARRGRGRRPRVQRSPEAPARRVQVPPALDRDRRGRAHAAERAAQLRDDRAARTSSTSTRSASTPSSRASAAGSSSSARRTSGATSKSSAIYDAQIAPHVAPARRAARDRDGGAVRGAHAHAQAEPRPLPARARRRSSASLTAVEKMDLYARGRAPERLDADAQKVLRAGIARGLRGERRLPDLRRPHRREPARDAHRAPRCGAEHDLRVPLAARGPDEIDELCQRRRGVRVAPGGAARRRLPRRQAFREALRDRLARRVGGGALASRAGSWTRRSTPSSSSATSSTSASG